MNNYLQAIIAKKHEEVAALKQQLALAPDHPITKILRGEVPVKAQKSFKQALRQENLAVIAELKCASPSRGVLMSKEQRDSLLQDYLRGGADAISVLTDPTGFGGCLADLTQTAAQLPATKCPVLRKDFIIDEVQIAQSIHAQADAILLIVKVLKEQTKVLLQKAQMLQIDALVEVHDYAELMYALEIGAEIIGINNRNLTTFELSIEHSINLYPHFPAGVIKVAESGITTIETARALRALGFDAVLIGEGLIKAADPVAFLQQIRA